MEYFDVLDSSGNYTGKTVSKDEAHKKGIIHRVVHVWIINYRNEVLLQKRDKTSRIFPSYWDISVAGHVSAGQSSLEAARQEAKDELGLDINLSEFKLISILQANLVFNNGNYLDNEFQDVYFVKKDLDIDQIKLNDGEVEAAKFISLDEFGLWVSGKGEPMVPHEEEYKLLLKYIHDLT